MNVNLFQKIADVLLQSHFGIALNDTHLGSAIVVSSLLTNNIRPFDAVNEHAEECDLVRTDIRGPWGVPTLVLLQRKEEHVALRTVQPSHLYGEELVHCGLCVARTEFDELDDIGPGVQHHRCLNPACGHEFMAEPEDDDRCSTCGKPIDFEGTASECSACANATVGG